MSSIPTRPKRKPNPDGRATLGALKARSQERTGLIVDEKLAAEARKLLNKLIHNSEALRNVVNDHMYEHREDIRDILSVSEAAETIVQDGIERVNHSVTQTFKNLEAHVDQRLKAIEAKAGLHLTVTRPDLSTTTVDNPHRLMPELLRHLMIGDDVALVGPSGSGKTHATKQAADIMGVPFYFIACSDADMPSKWFGYNNAAGDYVSTVVYKWFTEGGVLLIDEYDNMRANIGVSVNAILDPGIGDFPNGIASRHPEAMCVAAGNTIGRGASTLYKGRGAGLDESTLSRFSVIEWDYDPVLERTLAERQWWVTLVQAAREAVEQHKLQYLITPRASTRGDALLGTGLNVDATLARTVFKGWPRDDMHKVASTPDYSRAYRMAVEAFETEQEFAV